MMNPFNKSFLLPLAFFCSSAFSSPKEGTIKLYQIGKNGRYCVSTSGEESGCISGVNESKDWVNILDTLKDSNVEFYNLTDVVHDMRFSGVNAEDMPVQRPGAEAASKTMTQADPEKRSIECSFHGSQVGLGYRVVALEEKTAGHPGASQMANNPRVASINSNTDAEENIRPFSLVQSLAPTKLADVSAYVLANGNPEEADWLRKTRPELSNGSPEKTSEVNQIKQSGSTWEVGLLNPLPDLALSPVNISQETELRAIEEPAGIEMKRNPLERFPSWLIFTNGKYPDADKYYFEGGTLVLLPPSGDDFFNPSSLARNQELSPASLLPAGSSLGGSTQSLFKASPLGLVTPQNMGEPRKWRGSWMILLGLGLVTASRLFERRQGERRKNPLAQAPSIPVTNAIKGSGVSASALLGLKKSEKNKAL